jgi:pyochelin synthetase
MEMTTAKLPTVLAELAQAGIKLRLVDDSRIEVKAPKGRLSADLRTAIAEHKPDIIAWLSHAENGLANGTQLPSVTDLPLVRHDPAALFEPFPPSDLQTSFLIGSREGVEHYVRPHQYMELDFDQLDPARFTAALNRFLRRRRKDLAVVRDDLLLQTLKDPGPVQVGVTDLRHASDEDVRAAIERTRASMQRREPEHARWPWLDVHITRYGDDRARLHYNNNNLFCDAPSMMRLLAEVLGNYRDPDRELPELEISFRDCVLALAELEDSPRGQAAQKYWRDRMADWPDAPAVPLAAGARPRERSRLVRRELVFPPEIWKAIKRHASAQGLTPSSALLAAHAEMLACWSGSRHFLINNMITHRVPIHPQITEVLGNFASLYPLEVDWRHDEPFAERARRLQAQVMTDMEHAYWSGVKVLQALNQVRHTPGRAVCPFAAASALFVGESQRPVHSLLETPQVIFDCEFWALDDGSLWVVWDVIETMFPPALIDAMEQGFRSAIALLATEDGATWEAGALDLLPAQQRSARATLNRPAGSMPMGLLHDCVPRRAAEMPGKAAVVCPDGAISYGQLWRRSARQAARLTEAGLARGGRVPVVLPKSCEQAVAVVGILAAGGAYVPFDPSCPDDRLRFLFADVEAGAVLTSPELRDRLATLTDAPVLAVETAPAGATEAGQDAAGQDEAVDNAPPAWPAQDGPSPADLAYVIYTSGSTGRPKGAMLDHLGPLNTIADINRRFGVGPRDVVFGISSLCFDLSVFDVFGSLAAGATLVLPGHEQTDPATWLGMAAEHRITVWNSVPAVMQLFTEAAAAAGVVLPHLRLVLLSGDWIPVALPGRISEIAPNATVVSLGGATEASIWSICHPITGAQPDWPSIPYGKPLANQSWHVLDEHGRDVPEWVPGELYIGGVGLAKGYIGNPDKTSAAFISHPVTGERLYRTGDLGRYRPGGEIEFLGRNDFQVKIQGYRVEPGEVEHALLEHAQVGHAVVVARSTGSGRQLVGFAVPAPGAGHPDGQALRDFLASRLPVHLVPSRVIVLDTLPLTRNGKLDRRALEDMSPADSQPAGAGGDQQAREYIAARTPTEAVIAETWRSVLAASQVGVHDDFFDLGGQSYAALRVIGILAQRLGRRIPLGTLLEHRTVASLATWLQQAGDEWSPLVQLSGRGEETPWCLVHPAGGNVLCYDQLAGRLGAPVHALQAPGPLNGHEPLESVEDLAGLYLTALRRKLPDGPYRLGGWSSGAPVAFEIAHRLEQMGEAVEQVLIIDSPSPIAPGPPDDLTALLWFIEDLGTGFAAGDVTPGQLRRLSGLPEPERLAAALALAGQQGAQVNAPDPASLAATFPVFRGMVRACGSYRAPMLTAGMLVVRAAEGHVGEFDGHPASGAPDWGWASLTRGFVATASVPGTHHTLLTARHVDALADAIIAGQTPARRDRQMAKTS